ncbi:tetratricopeptide repeat protein [Embleya sp. NPDC001921]
MANARTPNTALVDVIAQSGWTYDRLARAVRAIAAENGEVLHTNKSAIAHWTSGVQPGNRTRRYLAEALSRRIGRTVTLVEIGLAQAEDSHPLMVDPITAAADLGRAGMRRDSFLSVAAFTVGSIGAPLSYDHDAVSRMLRARRPGTTIGAEEVATIRHVTAALGAADERHGGGHGLTTVMAYLADTAAPLLSGRFPSEVVRRDAFGAVAELAYLAGWKFHDLGSEGAAQRYYLTAYQLAHEADPLGHSAWMLRVLAHQALHLEHADYCLELTDEALRRASGRVGGGMEAVLWVTRARACAASGRPTEAARALLHAADAVARTDEPTPSYATATGPASGTVASQTARTLRDLGDHRNTERHYRAALSERDPEAFRRIHALTFVDLGVSLASQVRADEAVATWGEAMDHLGGVASSRHREAVAAMRRTLTTYKRRRVPGAANLDERARGLLAT